ncbi:MAG: tRNA pseudouridine synthase A [Lachnospiraceae bacterium]|jgi:tRNA pseudouridine38-40 synthase|nr:tRNA pseudouridine synthase A [Lachnospiraceae bacterium]
MRNIRLLIEYDGGRYRGWKKPEKDAISASVSDKIIAVLKEMTDDPDVELFGALRTEPGVHAYGQVANFKTNSLLSADEMKSYLNKYLPMDIAIVSVTEVPLRFSAGLNATSKTYLFRYCIDNVAPIFHRNYIVHCHKVPSVDRMRKAARYFLGRHDFRYFSSGKTDKSTIREIYSIDFTEYENEFQITIHANDFLHHMARLIIGTLLEIGYGTYDVEDVRLAFSGDIPPGSLCDPKGLFLKDVTYS